MSPSTTTIAMRALLIAFCVCAVATRADDVKAEHKKPELKSETVAAAAPTTMTKRDTTINGQQQMSLPNVSEDVLNKALMDRVFVQRQLKCATGEGPCDPIGRKIKANAGLVMRGMCFKCSQSEIKQIQRVMSHIQKNYPKEYAKMLKQYQTAN